MNKLEKLKEKLNSDSTPKVVRESIKQKIKTLEGNKTINK